MLNTASVNAVHNAQFSQRFIRPLYDSYCFATIPQTVQFLLTGEGRSALPMDVFGTLPTRYTSVILFFVDAFGWRFFERYADSYPFLKIALRDGVVSKMTSQFPSTTAAHVTCIHTGLNVGQSGVYEWHYYEPLVDDVICPLLFSYARDRERDTLKQAGFTPEHFFPRQSLYQQLARQGVNAHIFQSAAFTPSTASDVLFKGATVHAFQTFPQALGMLSHLLLAEQARPTYYFLYFDQIDAIGHMAGPDSPQFAQAVDHFLTSMEQIFYKNLSGKAKDTLFIMTADHGQIEVSPQTTIFLNKQVPGIERYLQTNQKGELLVPAGSARDMFLHVKEEFIDEVLASLQKLLEGRAEVYKVADLLAQHFFGPQEPSQVFLSRVGNVAILPYHYETVWWYKQGVFGMRFQGHHGGLTREEMEIPLIVLPL